MSRYRVRVHGVIDLDTVPGFDPLDPRPACQQLEGITTALFLRHIDAWQHLTIDVSERAFLRDGAIHGGPITRKVGLGGWHE